MGFDLPSSGRGLAVHAHFWSPKTEPPELAAWDPDAEPTAFPDGRGHAFYELAVRLRALGENITIGPKGAHRADLVVVFSKDLGMRQSLEFLLRKGTVPSVLIESDWLPTFRLPIAPTCAVVPVPGTSSADRVWLPLLPQRGMLRRHSERWGSVTTVSYKGDSRQVPRFLRGSTFAERARSLGFELIAQDLRDPVDSWHDFGDVDVVICMRDVELPTSHKPPTKLINSWVAGCIPLVGPEASYAALARNGVDALAVETETDVLSALGRLATDHGLVARLEQGVKERAAEFAPGTVLESWRSQLAATAASPTARHRRVLTHDLATWASAQARNLRNRSH